jgi:pimeloyl-ACP methyl ester carboxylesterase
LAKCLILWGEQDTVFGLEFGKAAANACEHGKLVPVNASHWVPEDVPEQVSSLIEQFVQQN